MISNEIKYLLDVLGNIPFNDNDEINMPWNDFPAGTNRFEIYEWFEKNYNISIAEDLMYKNEYDYK